MSSPTTASAVASRSALLHICIDCGGSKTAACLSSSASKTEILARGSAGPSNYKDNGLRVFLTAVRTAALIALRTHLGPEVDLPEVDDVLTGPNDAEYRKPGVLCSAWIGASGVDAAKDVKTLEPLLSRLLEVPLKDHRLLIANDAHIFASPLLTAEPPIESAVVVIAGTGSVVVSFRKETFETGGHSITQLARAGGWGFMLGDDGAGFFAGREAIRQVLEKFEADSLWEPEEADVNSHAPTSESPIVTTKQKETLTTLILSHFGLSSPDELFSVVYAPDPKPGVTPTVNTPSWALVERKQRLVALAPLVFKAAFELEDPTAIQALRVSVGGLAKQVASLCTSEGESIHPRKRSVAAQTSILALGGSLFGVPRYRELFFDELKAIGPRFASVVYVGDAARDGALGLANLFRDVNYLSD